MDTYLVGQRLEVMYQKVCFRTNSFYNLYINDIDEEVLCEIFKSSDDTKTARRVNTLNNIRSMQRALDKLVAWVNRLGMDFNVNNCEAMHIGKRNVEF